MAAAYVAARECWVIVVRVAAKLAGACGSLAPDGSLAALAGNAGYRRQRGS
jgi:hypothetical protein